MHVSNPRRSSLWLVVLVVIWAASLPASAAEPGTSTKRPNILLILADDQGYADLGVEGCNDIPTPHIDSIAKNGVRCTNGYVSHPYCSAARVGLQ